MLPVTDSVDGPATEFPLAQGHLPESTPSSPEDLGESSPQIETGLEALHLKAVPGGYRELLVIAIPMVISSGMQSLMHVFDRIFLTWYSQDAVAASLPAGMLYWTCFAFPFGIISYTNAMVAQYDGAKRPAQASKCVWQAIYLAIGCGLIITLPALCSEWLFRMIGHEPRIQKLETVYFSWICIGAVPALLSGALSCFFSGRGQTRLVLAVNAISTILDIFLDYAMIFGMGPIPELGMAGAAISTNLGSVFAVICYVFLLMRPDATVTYSFWKNWRFDSILMKDVCKFGGASGLQMFLDVAGFAVFMMIIGMMKGGGLAATNIAFNLNTLAFIPVIGVGIAVSTLVGQRIGEKRPEIAEKSARKGFVVAGGFMLVCGLGYVLAPEILLAPYEYGANSRAEQKSADKTNDDIPIDDVLNATLGADELPKGVTFAEVKAAVIMLLRFVAIYSFFDAMAIVFGSAIRAAGDTVFSMKITCACAWGLLVLPTWLTWRYLGGTNDNALLFWSWVWCSVYVVALGLIFFARFQGGRWKSMTIVEPPLEEAT